jgi:streptogramin lyase
MDLTTGGAAYEVNPDAEGNLWVSVYEADEIWQVDWAGGTYTIYHDLAGAGDGKRGTAGHVWWTGYDDGWLGRLSVDSGTVTTWTIPGAEYPWGIAFDDAGRVWVTDDGGPRVYRFDPATTEVCTYTYDGGYSDYVVFDSGALWLGDPEEYQLVRLDPVANQFTRWGLPGAEPVGLAVDEAGHLWWADDGLGALGRLDPANNVVTTYTLPFGGSPTMIAPDGARVWYAEVLSDSFGFLRPAAANGISATVVPTPTSVVSTCVSLGTGTTSAAVTSSGTITWTAGSATPAVDGGGWRVYELPSGAYPWGIAVDNGIWIVDQDRDKLILFAIEVYLPFVARSSP